MTLKITLRDVNGDGLGVNLGMYLDEFEETFEASEQEFAGSPTQPRRAFSGFSDTGFFFEVSSGTGKLNYNEEIGAFRGAVDEVRFGQEGKPDVIISGVQIRGTSPDSALDQLIDGLLDGDATVLRSRIFDSPQLQVIGSAGHDKVVGTTLSDSLSGRGGSDRLFGGAGFDTLSGGDGNDFLYAGNGSDTLIGGDGVNRLFGGRGEDTFIDRCNSGDDRMTGGSGYDSFMYSGTLTSPGIGVDHITDFTIGRDRIYFDTPFFFNFDEVMRHTTDVNGNAVISYDSGNRITLFGVSKAELSASNIVVLD
jgi:serralysin